MKGREADPLWAVPSRRRWLTLLKPSTVAARHARAIPQAFAARDRHRRLNYSNPLKSGPDLEFETGGIAPGINQCSFGVERPEGWLDLRISSTDKNKPWSAPLLAPTSGSLYRIRCPTLVSNSKIEARIAIVSRNDEHVEPQWPAMSVDFEASFRHRHWFFPQCFKGSCGEIPETIFGRR